jgi:putative transposase
MILWRSKSLCVLCQERCGKTYGYRRIHIWLRKQGIHRNPKTVLRVMKKYDLLSEIRRRRRWKRMGEHVHKYENLLNRNFSADRRNSKWVTDISYIHTREGVLYLSMIRDLFDNSIIAYKTGTEQTVNLVLDTIRLAVKQEKKTVATELQLHSDQGFQYTSTAYFNLTQAYGITPSMSRRGNCYDNAMAENFFSILKTECIDRAKPKTIVEANNCISAFIYFYNHERIQLKTGEAPLARRFSA